MATWDRFKSKTTSFETRSYIGGNFQVRFFCDDSTAIVYMAKPPVCKLKVTPLTQFINTNVAWDISQSISATGTIDTFDIAFGGGGPTDITAGDWDVDPLSANVQYTSTGTYTITASVTDTLAVRSSQQTIQVKIIDANDFVNLQRLYIGTTDGGIYYLEPNGSPTAINTGLTGDDLKIRAVRLDPTTKDLPTANHHLWACNATGIIKSTNGGSSWTEYTKANLGVPDNAAADSPAVTTSDLDQIDLCFDPQDPQLVYVLRTTATRAWLYYTDDQGTTWSNYQVQI